jgi:hypothetical protein
MYDVGDTSTGLAVQTAEGESMSLSEALDHGHHILLIFPRQLG